MMPMTSRCLLYSTLSPIQYFTGDTRLRRGYRGSVVSVSSSLVLGFRLGLKVSPPEILAEGPRLALFFLGGSGVVSLSGARKSFAEASALLILQGTRSISEMVMSGLLSLSKRPKKSQTALWNSSFFFSSFLVVLSPSDSSSSSLMWLLPPSAYLMNSAVFCCMSMLLLLLPDDLLLEVLLESTALESK